MLKNFGFSVWMIIKAVRYQIRDGDTIFSIHDIRILDTYVKSRSVQHIHFANIGVGISKEYVGRASKVFCLVFVENLDNLQ